MQEGLHKPDIKGSRMETMSTFGKESLRPNKTTIDALNRRLKERFKKNEPVSVQEIDDYVTLLDTILINDLRNRIGEHEAEGSAKERAARAPSIHTRAQEYLVNEKKIDEQKAEVSRLRKLAKLPGGDLALKGARTELLRLQQIAKGDEAYFKPRKAALRWAREVELARSQVPSIRENVRNYIDRAVEKRYGKKIQREPKLPDVVSALSTTRPEAPANITLRARRTPRFSQSPSADSAGEALEVSDEEFEEAKSQFETVIADAVMEKEGVVKEFWPAFRAFDAVDMDAEDLAFAVLNGVRETMDSISPLHDSYMNRGFVVIYHSLAKKVEEALSKDMSESDIMRAIPEYVAQIAGEKEAHEYVVLVRDVEERLRTLIDQVGEPTEN